MHLPCWRSITWTADTTQRAAGLAAQTQALELVAHNLANLSTTGYRGQQTTFRSSADGKYGVGERECAQFCRQQLWRSQRQPPGYDSGQPGRRPEIRWMSALAAADFLTVQSRRRERYTRATAVCTLRPNGQLVTSQGNAVLGAAGPVTLPSGNVAISSDGTISVEGAVVDNCGWRNFRRQTNLTAVGNATYSAPADSALVAADFVGASGDARRVECESDRGRGAVDHGAAQYGHAFAGPERARRVS